MPGSTNDADAIDIEALLRVALEQRPRTDLSDRIVGRVAAMATITELGRLIVAAPFAWLADELAPDPPDPQLERPRGAQPRGER